MHAIIIITIIISNTVLNVGIEPPILLNWCIKDWKPVSKYKVSRNLHENSIGNGNNLSDNNTVNQEICVALKSCGSVSFWSN